MIPSHSEVKYTESELKELWKYAHTRPGWLSMISERLNLNDKVVSLLEHLDESRRQAIKELEAGWRKARFKEPTPESPQWAKERRREYLEGQVETLRSEISKVYMAYLKAQEKDTPLVDRLLMLKCSNVEETEKKLKHFSLELDVLNAKREGIPESSVEQARQFPLERLVTSVKNGYILCPLHNDHNPSMWIKNGFGYCFSCNGTLDSIGYMMKVKGLSFKEAVFALQ